MRRLILPVMAVLGFAAATCALFPRAWESFELLHAENDPAMLADIAVAKGLSAPVAQTEIENALAAGDAELAASFLELARDRGVTIEPALAARVEAANSSGAQVVHAAMS